jgi:hypothetical protein
MFTILFFDLEIEPLPTTRAERGFVGANTAGNNGLMAPKHRGVSDINFWATHPITSHKMTYPP